MSYFAFFRMLNCAVVFYFENYNFNFFRWLTPTLAHVLHLSGQELAPTGQKPLLKDSWRHNNVYVDPSNCLYNP